MDGIEVTLKHSFGEDKLILDKEVVNVIALEAAQDNVTFEKKFNELLAKEMKKIKEKDEESNTIKEY